MIISKIAASGAAAVTGTVRERLLERERLGKREQERFRERFGERQRLRERVDKLNFKSKTCTRHTAVNTQPQI